MLRFIKSLQSMRIKIHQAPKEIIVLFISTVREEGYDHVTKAREYGKFYSEWFVFGTDFEEVCSGRKHWYKVIDLNYNNT